MPQQYYFNPFTTWTLMCDNPPIPWQFSVENKHTRAPKINHMRSKTRDKLWLSNKLFLLYELMGSQGMQKKKQFEKEKAVERGENNEFQQNFFAAQ